MSRPLYDNLNMFSVNMKCPGGLKEENKMTLQKRPEEFEQDGYRWVCTNGYTYSCDRDERSITYIRKEKLYVPPTMKEIMNHLVTGGWVKVTYEYTSGAIYIRLKADGKDTEYFDTAERHKEWQGHDIYPLFVENSGKKELIHTYPGFIP